MSVSGRPDTPASLPPRSHPRCDARWNPPDHVGARTLDDTQEPLPFLDKASDDVVASLVLHYLGDWAGPLGELRRVLKPRGRLILSVNHPLVRVFTHPDEDYFATRQYSEDYEFAGEEVTLTHWHRALHAMINAFTAAEFDITLVSEPTPSPNTPVEFLTPASVAARQLRSYRSSSSCSELAESIIDPQLDRAVATHDSTHLCPFRAWQASS